MKLSAHFELHEFTNSITATRYGIKNEPSPQVLENLRMVAYYLEHIRNTLGEFAITINSGYRCLELNRKIGSSSTSAHVAGHAVDFTCKHFGTPKEIAQKLMAAGYKFDQLIVEGDDGKGGGWVHISFDPRFRGESLTATFKNGKAVYTKGIQ